MNSIFNLFYDRCKGTKLGEREDNRDFHYGLWEFASLNFQVRNE